MMAWCKFFQLALSYDQIDVTTLACAELGARRVQMISDRWKNKLPGFSGGAQGEEDDSHLLLGTSETRGNICVAPSLQKWLGEELSKEAQASKERRKAREERALSSKKT